MGNNSFYETTTAVLCILPSRGQGRTALCLDVTGSGSKTTGEGMAALPHTGTIPDRKAIPVSGMKCFHCFLPNSSASASADSIFVPWLALVWRDEVHGSLVGPLNTPSSSFAIINLLIHPNTTKGFCFFLRKRFSMGWLPYLASYKVFLFFLLLFLKFYF